MKGIIFNLAEEVVVNEHGDGVWDAVLEGAGVSGSYTSLGSYPDADMMTIVASAARLLDTEQGAVLRHVAQGAIPLLAERYPHFFTPHRDAQSFLLTLNDMIHPEVRKLYPGADVPNFTYHVHGENAVTLAYESGRRLCALAEGFVAGAAAHYGQQVEIEQHACMLLGDPTCLLHCEFSSAAG
jgi:hypothetical protein